MPVAAGQLLSHYRLLAKTGEGGMGEVWKAHDVTLDRTVAIKLLPDHLAGDAEWLSRFAGEARAIAALNHPNIVTIYSVEEAEGVHFFTMEFVTGRTLERLIPQAGLPLSSFLDIAVPLVDAIAATHERGIIHRDLKPANVMVTDEGRVKVLDFGLASHGDLEESVGAPVPLTEALDSTSLVWGTLPYLSPERILGSPVDCRSDIFSLGILLFEMATGRRPFAGSTAGEVFEAISRHEPPLVSDVRRDVPLYVSRMIRQCLEKDPALRPHSAGALRGELEEFRRELEAARRARAPSIAVMPFVDMSREHDQDHFCEGIAGEIVNALARVGSLRVASRQSSFRFKSAARDSREIGRELGVDALLEGSVRKVGERLRITAELTAVRDGICLWSELYDREMRDIFAIQAEIARSLVQALQVTLSPTETRVLSKAATHDVEAYDLYLRGRQYYFQASRRGMGFALQMLTRAIERDPDFALAYAGIADCHVFLYHHVARSEDNLSRADAASRRALELDPELAETHVSRGLVLSLRGQHDAAEPEFETAVRLNAQLFEAYYSYARDSFMQGKLDKAVRLYERAMALRPDDYQSPLLVAQIYADLGRAADAEAIRRRGLKVAEEHLEIHPDDTRALYMAANAMAAMGERPRALEWAGRALALDPNDSMVLYNVACIYSLAGSYEEALDCLDRAISAGLVLREWIVNDSNLDPLRDRPRYHALLARLEEVDRT